MQANNKKVWQAARTGNNPKKLATLRQKSINQSINIRLMRGMSKRRPTHV